VSEILLSVQGIIVAFGVGAVALALWCVRRGRS
jgi:hypothetical protein